MINKRMRFGIFLAPFHAVEENPTNAIERDFELVEHLGGQYYNHSYPVLWPRDLSFYRDIVKWGSIDSLEIEELWR